MAHSPSHVPSTKVVPVTGVRRLVAWAAWLALWLSLAAPARAEPPAAAPASDPVLQFLQQRGVLGAEAAGEAAAVVRQVRDAASELVLSAMAFLGVPYRRGGNAAEEGFDCSGFTRHVFEMSVGLVLPRRVDDQASASGLSRIAREELRPGDLVFFNTLRRTFSHVGIYIGDGKFVHAPRSGSQVRVEDMRSAYWDRRFTGARRADRLEAPAAVMGVDGTAPERATAPR